MYDQIIGMIDDTGQGNIFSPIGIKRHAGYKDQAS